MVPWHNFFTISNLEGSGLCLFVILRLSHEMCGLWCEVAEFGLVFTKHRLTQPFKIIIIFQAKIIEVVIDKSSSNHHQ